LGRNATDVHSTIDTLVMLGVRVHCLALCGADLTSSAGHTYDHHADALNPTTKATSADKDDRVAERDHGLTLIEGDDIFQGRAVLVREGISHQVF
jgi:hypothetical protein